MSSLSSKKLSGASYARSGSLGGASSGHAGSVSASRRPSTRQAMKVLKGAEAERATRASLGEVTVDEVKEGATKVGEVKGSGVQVASGDLRTFSPEAVRRPATSSLQDRVEKARSAGYEEGYRKGMEDAISSMQAERVELVAKLASSIEEAAGRLAEGRYEVLKVASREVVDLAVRIAGAILLRELAVSRNPGREALERAVGLVPQGSDLVIRMHPDDAVNPDDLVPLVNGESITIVADDSVERGGCVVQAGSCTVDGQISTALKRVADLLGSSVQDIGLSLQGMSGRVR
ncbi:MAG: FliH/SctL family protein [Actinobacteria bacterium]|nr:FliH/SctL family protein [Actinomycetota bacterium]